MNQVTRRYYLGSNKDEPKRKVKSKRFGIKVMFLAAVARPRWDLHENKWFDGKIGIWPFTEVAPAQRRSVNRPAGTMVTKPMNVSAVAYRCFLIDKLLPAIKATCLANSATCIRIQQDNARPHIGPTDVEFTAAAERLELNTRLVCQPPNSPDLNVLDLGFFTSIQALQYEEAPSNIDELIDVVQSSFDKLKKNTLNNVFLTLQKVMEACIMCDGNNTYKLPHINKARLKRLGELPNSIKVSDALREKINECI